MVGRAPLLATLVCLCAGMAAIPSTALASGGAGPTISVSGPLTNPTVTQAVHPIPIRVSHPDGVAAITIRYDGQLVRTITPNATSWTGDAGPYDATASGGHPPGPHTVTIAAGAAVEGYGSSRTLSFTIVHDSTPPVISLSGTLYDQRTPAILEIDSYGLSVSATDGTIGASASGLKSVSVSVDANVVAPGTAQPCQAPVGGTCDISLSYILNSAAVSEGTHSVVVRAEDQAGNASTQTFGIDLEDRAPADYGTPEDGTCAMDPDIGVNDCADDEQPAGFNALAAAPLTFGIADENFAGGGYDLFADQAFTGLGVAQVRRTVPFNLALVTTTPEGRTDIANAVRWVRDALATGKIPVITFNRCRYATPGAANPATYCTTPPPYDDYTAAVRAFLTYQSDQDPNTKELSDVQLLSAWNEPNLNLRNDTAGTPPPDSPLAWIYTGTGTVSKENSGAFLAGRFARYVDFKCRETNPDRCSAIAGEFLDSDMNDLDQQRLVSTKYLRQYRLGIARKPKYWGWHAYKDGAAAPSIANNADRWKRLRKFVTATVPRDGSAAPPIWLLEQGPRWQFRGRVLGMTDALAAKVIDCYTHASQVDARVTRFYLYQMLGSPGFDSGLRDFAQQGAPLRAQAYAAYQGRSDPSRTC
jgi:hypothetical protein